MHRIIIPVLLFVLGSASGFAQLLPVRSTAVPTLSFGMIGFATGETARLNVVNLVRSAPAVAIAQIPCKVELDFYDSQGNLLKQKVIADLGYGKADQLDLDRGEVTTASGRTQVAAVVKLGSTQTIFCSIAPTVEIFDNLTGRTSAILVAPSAPLTVFAPALTSQ